MEFHDVLLIDGLIIPFWCFWGGEGERAFGRAGFVKIFYLFFVYIKSSFLLFLFFSIFSLFGLSRYGLS
jgi:hypothetical protein